MSSPIDELLDEQLRYYGARAPEYSQTAMVELAPGELETVKREFEDALESSAPAGDVLELACGPGTWTAELLRRATSLTALDGSPEMLALAQARVRDDRVRFVQANIFEWRPERAYDGVFFAFWLSHVPRERFAQFWRLVADCLKPGGRVMFVDDSYRTPEELVEGEDSDVIRRQLTDGTAYRAVKVSHRPEELERRLARLGWRISVTPLAGPFFWGVGSRS